MNGYVKKQALMDYCSNQVTRTIDLNDIARFPIVEIYTKADVVAMLTDIQLEIEESENCGKAFHLGLQMASNIIQQEIDKLKG